MSLRLLNHLRLCIASRGRPRACRTSVPIDSMNCTWRGLLQVQMGDAVDTIQGDGARDPAQEARATKGEVGNNFQLNRGYRVPTKSSASCVGFDKIETLMSGGGVLGRARDIRRLGVG